MKVCAVFAYENFEKQATWSFSQVALIALTTFLHTLAVLDIAVRKSSGLPFNAIGMKTVFQQGPGSHFFVYHGSHWFDLNVKKACNS